MLDWKKLVKVCAGSLTSISASINFPGCVGTPAVVLNFLTIESYANRVKDGDYLNVLVFEEGNLNGDLLSKVVELRPMADIYIL